MKIFGIISFALVTAPALAFVSTQSKTNSNALAGMNKEGLMELAKAQNNVVKFYDPISLADGDFWGQGEEATIGWLRQAEIKHGRVAMAAFVGYCVQRNFQWPFAMQLDGTRFPASNMSPELQWDNLPEMAKYQIFTFIAILELLDESYCGDLEARPHYMRGGQPGKFPEFNVNLIPNLYDPIGFNKKQTDEQKARRLNMEVNNGRLAMLGIFGFLSADTVPGSVPALVNIAKHYDGNVMVPFEGQFTLL